MTGFHDGELEVQQKAGVAHDAARLQGMLRPASLEGGAKKFLTQRDFVAITARDGDGRPWTTALSGLPGFLDSSGSTLTIRTAPGAGDPLHGVPAWQAVGVLVIDLALRRRVRINGELVRSTDGELEIAAEQAYGNCPQYIHPQRGRPPASGLPIGTDGSLARGADCVDRSPRRTRSSSVPRTRRAAPTPRTRVASPASSGSTAATSGGRTTPATTCSTASATSPSTRRLRCSFVDFTTGTTLHLSGTATIEWDADSETGRAVRFHPTRSVLNSWN